MDRLLAGVRRFREEVFPARRELFERLAHGQSPEVLFVTCSDSRITPDLLTQTEPGDLFVLRNAGNIIPPYNPSLASGTAGTVEFAVAKLGVRHIVICGHAPCGAVKALIEPDPEAHLVPALTTWLEAADITRQRIREGAAVNDPFLVRAAQVHVRAQMEQLARYPIVADRLQAGRLALYGWVYEIGTGAVHGYDASSDSFIPLNAPPPEPASLNSLEA